MNDDLSPEEINAQLAALRRVPISSDDDYAALVNPSLQANIAYLQDQIGRGREDVAPSAFNALFLREAEKARRAQELDNLIALRSRLASRLAPSFEAKRAMADRRLRSGRAPRILPRLAVGGQPPVPMRRSMPMGQPIRRPVPMGQPIRRPVPMGQPIRRPVQMRRPPPMQMRAPVRRPPQQSTLGQVKQGLGALNMLGKTGMLGAGARQMLGSAGAVAGLAGLAKGEFTPQKVVPAISAINTLAGTTGMAAPAATSAVSAGLSAAAIPLAGIGLVAALSDRMAAKEQGRRLEGASRTADRLAAAGVNLDPTKMYKYEILAPRALGFDEENKMMLAARDKYELGKKLDEDYVNRMIAAVPGAAAQLPGDIIHDIKGDYGNIFAKQIADINQPIIAPLTAQITAKNEALLQEDPVIQYLQNELKNVSHGKESAEKRVTILDKLNAYKGVAGHMTNKDRMELQAEVKSKQQRGNR